MTSQSPHGSAHSADQHQTWQFDDLVHVTNLVEFSHYRMQWIVGRYGGINTFGFLTFVVIQILKPSLNELKF